MDLNKSGIYKIVNKVNGREYYGSAEKFKRRKNAHFRLLRTNNHSNKFLQNDFNKNGEENFEFKIIEYCKIEELIQYEQRFLDKYFDKCDQCYNMLPIAGSSKGRKLSAETKAKMSEAQKGENNSFYGKTHSAEAKQKMSKLHKGNQYNLGRKLSAETKQKLSKLNKGSNHPKYNHTIYHFYNAKLNITEKCTQYELRTQYDLNAGNLSEVISGRKKSCGGWTCKSKNIN